ncbi:MAG: hypothetical protein HDKAJFGB_01026 [Anaerolineae bacterium]|nr:hypothetical protein [Anaerolineae bacterium]
MRIAGEQCVEMALCLIADGRLQMADGRINARNRVHDVQTRIRCDLIVARASGVQFVRGFANQFVQTPFDGGVNVFVVWSRNKFAARKFIAHAEQAAFDFIRFVRRNNFRARQRFGIRETAANVRVVQAPIEMKRIVEPREQFIRLFVETRAPEHLNCKFEIANCRFDKFETCNLQSAIALIPKL